MFSYYKNQIKVIRVRYLLTYAFGEDQSLQKEECNKINHMNMARGKKYILKLINKCNISSHNNEMKLNSKFQLIRQFTKCYGYFFRKAHIRWPYNCILT